MSKEIPQECKVMMRTTWLDCSVILRTKNKEAKNSRHDGYINAAPEWMNTDPKKELMRRMVTAKRYHPHLTIICPSRPAKMIGMSTFGRTFIFVIGARYAWKREVGRNRTIEEEMLCVEGCRQSAWTIKKSARAARRL